MPSTSSEEKSGGSLPGMKRGIAIGVGVCVTIVIIAIVSYLAIKRRRRLKKPQDVEKVAEPGTPLPPQIHIETAVTNASSDVKHHSVFLEPDSSPVHEMSTEIMARELMTKENSAELTGDQRVVYELDGSEVAKPERTAEQDAKDRYLRVDR